MEKTSKTDPDTVTINGSASPTGEMEFDESDSSHIVNGNPTSFTGHDDKEPSENQVSHTVKNGNGTLKTPDPDTESHEIMEEDVNLEEKSRISSSKEPAIEEKLFLLPEEVIFLSFGVGCLSIQSSVSGDILSYQQVWKILVEKNPEFPFIYAVYHYFRAKNWVPKAGLQFGGDYGMFVHICKWVNQVLIMDNRFIFVILMFLPSVVSSWSRDISFHVHCSYNWTFVATQIDMD